MNQPNPSPSPADSQRIFELVSGKMVTRAIGAVAEAGLADQLARGAKTAAELASSSGCHPDAVFRVLRALVPFGLFTHDESGRFALTSLGATLRSDVPGSMRAMACMMNLPKFAWHTWAGFDHSLRTGEPAFDAVHGQGVFQYLQDHPGDARTFDESMTAFSAGEAMAAAEVWKLDGVRFAIDVGGGHGHLLATLLAPYPNVRGMVYDMPHVVAGARERAKASPERARLEFQPGDFFAAVPPGADLYMMKHIIHDWSDERCITILTHCRRGLVPGGRIAVLEMVVPDGPEMHPSKLLDLEMLVMTGGGRERTAAEFRSLFTRAGLRLTRILPTASPLSILECEPV